MHLVEVRAVTGAQIHSLHRHLGWLLGRGTVHGMMAGDIKMKVINGASHPRAPSWEDRGIAHPTSREAGVRDRVRDQVLWQTRQMTPFCGLHPELRT